MVQTTARFILGAMFLMKAMMPAAPAESRPEVGSSRHISDGVFTKARAKERRRFWPPERPLARVAARLEARRAEQVVDCALLSGDRVYRAEEAGGVLEVLAARQVLPLLIELRHVRTMFGEHWSTQRPPIESD